MAAPRHKASTLTEAEFFTAVIKSSQQPITVSPSGRSITPPKLNNASSQVNIDRFAKETGYSEKSAQNRIAKENKKHGMDVSTTKGKKTANDIVREPQGGFSEGFLEV